MFARNWDLWIEYDHMGFGTKNVLLNGTPIYDTGFSTPVAYSPGLDSQDPSWYRLSLRLGQSPGRREILIRYRTDQMQSPGIVRGFFVWLRPVLHCTEVSLPMSQMGHELPRRQHSRRGRFSSVSGRRSGIRSSCIKAMLVVLTNQENDHARQRKPSPGLP